MLKIQLCITGINYILKYIQIEKLFLILTMFYNITVFYCFFIKKKNTHLVSIRDFQKCKKNKNK